MNHELLVIDRHADIRLRRRRHIFPLRIHAFPRPMPLLHRFQMFHCQVLRARIAVNFLQDARSLETPPIPAIRSPRKDCRSPRRPPARPTPGPPPSLLLAPFGSLSSLTVLQFQFISSSGLVRRSINPISVGKKPFHFPINILQFRVQSPPGKIVKGLRPLNIQRRQWIVIFAPMILHADHRADIQPESQARGRRRIE